MEKEIEGKRLFSVWRPPAADMKQTYLSFCATVFFFFFFISGVSISSG